MLDVDVAEGVPPPPPPAPAVLLAAAPAADDDALVLLAFVDAAAAVLFLFEDMLLCFSILLLLQRLSYVSLFHNQKRDTKVHFHSAALLSHLDTHTIQRTQNLSILSSAHRTGQCNSIIACA